jgi:hypothetical protein
VPWHPPQRRVEAQLQDRRGARDGQRSFAGAESVRFHRSAADGGCVAIEFGQRDTNDVGHPHRDDAVEASIADEYKNRKASFERTAKDWTKQYAK